MSKQKPKFKRTDFAKYSKLGVRRKKKQIYRKAKGRDNKIRLKMKGHIRNVSIGFRTKKTGRDLIQKLKPIRVYNLSDLKKIGSKEIGIIAKIGTKKKKELLEAVVKENIKITVDAKKELEKIDEKLKKLKEKKKNIQEKKIARDKKAQKEAEKKAKKQAKEEKSENVKADSSKKESEDKKNKEADNKQSQTASPKQGKEEIKSNNYGRGN